MALFKRAEPLDKSNMMFSTKYLVKLMIPLMLQQILNMTVGVVNAVMVSHAGDAAVSGVSLVNTMDAMLVIFFTALVSGGSVVLSQAVGKNETGGISNAAKQLMYAAAIMACILTTVVLVFRYPLLDALFGSVEQDVMDSAHAYFFPVALTFPLLAISESIHACLRVDGKTADSLMVSIVTNIVNIIGNAIFVIVLDLGAFGSALSTVVIRILAVIILLIMITNKKRKVHMERLLHYKPDLNVIKKILHIGIPNGIENTLFNFGRLLTQTLIALLPTATIAAHSVALNIANYQYAVNTAFACAVIPVIGQCIGAKREDQAKYYSRLLIKLEYVMMWVVILVTIVLVKPILATYDVSAEAKQLAYWLILTHAVVVAFIYPLGFLLPNIFHAASDVKFKLFVSMGSMWGIRIAFAYVLALPEVSVFGLFSFTGFGMGMWGVWIAMMLDWLFRAILYTIRFLTDRWLRVKKPN